jgi:hypothetical protein
MLTGLKKPIIIIPLTKLKDGCIMTGVITHKDSKLPLSGAHILITNKSTGDTLYSYTVRENGKFLFAGLKGIVNIKF